MDGNEKWEKSCGQGPEEKQERAVVAAAEATGCAAVATVAVVLDRVAQVQGADEGTVDQKGGGKVQAVDAKKQDGNLAAFDQDCLFGEIQTLDSLNWSVILGFCSVPATRVPPN